jgi:hypothetical protein
MKTLDLIVIVVLLSFMNLTAIGQCTFCSGGNVTGTNASGLGTSPTATGHSSFAGGHTATASGDYSFAFGYQSQATGSSSIAFGSKVEASTTSSMLFGRHLKAMSSGSCIIGTGDGPDYYLINSEAYSLMVGFDSQYPTLFVSSSYGSSSTGKIGIGNITSPTSKLHILSDEHEAAEIKLEHRTTGIRQYAQVLLGTHSIRAGNAENMVFTTPTGRDFEFQTGNVGIGTDHPDAKLQVTGGDIFIEDINRGIIMKSPDGNCWRGILNNQGQLEFTMVSNCIITSISDNYNENESEILIIPNPASGNIQISGTVKVMEKFSEYSLLDITGSQVRTGIVLNPNTTVNIQGLAPGTYILCFSGKGTSRSEKVIIR